MLSILFKLTGTVRMEELVLRRHHSHKGSGWFRRGSGGQGRSAPPSPHTAQNKAGMCQQNPKTGCHLRGPDVVPDTSVVIGRMNKVTVAGGSRFGPLMRICSLKFTDRSDRYEMFRSFRILRNSVHFSICFIFRPRRCSWLPFP